VLGDRERREKIKEQKKKRKTEKGKKKGSAAENQSKRVS
jgi:hypothetical protein